MRALFSFVRRWLVVAWSSFVRLVATVRADRALLIIFAALLFVDLGWTLWYGVAKLLYNMEIDTSYYALLPEASPKVARHSSPKVKEVPMLMVRRSGCPTYLWP